MPIKHKLGESGRDFCTESCKICAWSQELIPFVNFLSSEINCLRLPSSGCSGIEKEGLTSNGAGSVVFVLSGASCVGTKEAHFLGVEVFLGVLIGVAGITMSLCKQTRDLPKFIDHPGIIGQSLTNKKPTRTENCWMPCG